jgi:hypothetical protein
MMQQTLRASWKIPLPVRSSMVSAVKSYCDGYDKKSTQRQAQLVSLFGVQTFRHAQTFTTPDTTPLCVTQLTDSIHAVGTEAGIYLLEYKNGEQIGKKRIAKRYAQISEIHKISTTTILFTYTRNICLYDWKTQTPLSTRQFHTRPYARVNELKITLLDSIYFMVEDQIIYQFMKIVNNKLIPEHHIDKIKIRGDERKISNARIRPDSISVYSNSNKYSYDILTGTCTSTRIDFDDNTLFGYIFIKVDGYRLFLDTLHVMYIFNADTLERLQVCQKSNTLRYFMNLFVLNDQYMVASIKSVGTLLLKYDETAITEIGTISGHQVSNKYDRNLYATFQGGFEWYQANSYVFQEKDTQRTKLFNCTRGVYIDLEIKTTTSL